MADKPARILSNGLAADAITMDDIDYITDLITPYLSDGDYAWAFSEFADQCEIYINGYINGYPFPAGTMVIVGLVVGFAVYAFAMIFEYGQTLQQESDETL